MGLRGNSGVRDGLVGGFGVCIFLLLFGDRRVRLYHLSQINIIKMNQANIHPEQLALGWPSKNRSSFLVYMTGARTVYREENRTKRPRSGRSIRPELTHAARVGTFEGFGCFQVGSEERWG